MASVRKSGVGEHNVPALLHVARAAAWKGQTVPLRGNVFAPAEAAAREAWQDAESKRGGGASRSCRSSQGGESRVNASRVFACCIFDAFFEPTAEATM